jgi:ABC-type dipeptide/oligopeptide/nickel transport system permease component
MIMVPTMFVVSVIVFTVIQLPPGDYLTSYIFQLESRGEDVDLEQIEELRDMFELEKSVVERYFNWIGLKWFVSFEDQDRGLLQGRMGRSMQTLQSVNELVGDRLMLTMAISFCSILFTWMLALPIGVYSAVRQYSIGDYAVTFIGFLGMCIPNFLLALILMYVSMAHFDMAISGLFSIQYASEPDWSWGKVIDLLKHIWVPVVVIGTGSTAWMIRVMRGNLLDELKKPYVTTARAKGVKPLKLILKYPVRIALNPFISSIGGIFPTLVSGSAIVALILSLPTVGPLLLTSLQTEDMYLAGSLLMLLSLLSVLGTLVSDLLLLALDPRIRMEGGAD